MVCESGYELVLSLTGCSAIEDFALTHFLLLAYNICIDQYQSGRTTWYSCFYAEY